MTASDPLYLSLDEASVFGLYDPPEASGPPRTAVVVCSPWGWDETASYKSRQTWAKQLAAAGHPTLRFDLPGVGNSSGSPFDEGLVEAWVASVAAAVASVRERSGAGEAVLLGLGLGGLLARAAIAAGAAADGLVLWGAPATGKAFARETRAFSRLQLWNGEFLDRIHPGSLEAGGFVLSATTRSELEGLELEPVAGTGLRRALLLDRDGVGADESLGEALEEAGVEVTRARGEGWSALIGHPESSSLTPASVERVERWLREGAAPEGGAETPSTTVPNSVDVLEDVVMTETPWTLEQDFGTAFGVLCEPAEKAPGGVCAIFLNSGANPNIGPNRLWVDAARTLAARGVPSLRLDFESIGESDGDNAKFSDVAAFYEPQYEDQVHAAIADLVRRGVAERFLVTGLCSGSYWAFRTAQSEPRIESIVLINSGALIWDPNLISERALREMDRFRSGDWWRRLFSGQISAAGGLRALRVLGRRLLETVSRLWRRLTPSEEPGPTLESELDSLSEQGTRLVFAFSEGEALHFELERDGILAQLDRWPNVALIELPGGDHSLRPVEAQLAAVEMFEAELAGAARPAEASVPPPR